MGTNAATVRATDPRRGKQCGAFGEALVMCLLTAYRNMKVAVVDHAGADLVASDVDNQAGALAATPSR